MMSFSPAVTANRCRCDPHASCPPLSYILLLFTLPLATGNITPGLLHQSTPCIHSFGQPAGPPVPALVNVRPDVISAHILADTPGELPGGDLAGYPAHDAFPVPAQR